MKDRGSHLSSGGRGNQRVSDLKIEADRDFVVVPTPDRLWDLLCR